MPAPEGGKAFVDPVGVRDSAHVGQLTPLRSRLGSIPSLRARATRGTSLCYIFLLFVVSVVFHLLVLSALGEAALVWLAFRGEGPLGPRAEIPSVFCRA